MALEDFETVQSGNPLCHVEDCENWSVTSWCSEDNPRGGRFYPLCFQHAFEAALSTDGEAQRKALVWAVKVLDGMVSSEEAQA